MKACAAVVGSSWSIGTSILSSAYHKVSVWTPGDLNGKLRTSANGLVPEPDLAGNLDGYVEADDGAISVRPLLVSLRDC